MISEYPDFHKWQTSVISYAPNLEIENEIGYHDWLLADYNHKPNEVELCKLMERFKFELFSETYQTIEAGIDTNLWWSTFEWTPEAYLNRP